MSNTRAILKRGVILISTSLPKPRSITLNLTTSADTFCVALMRPRLTRYAFVPRYSTKLVVVGFEMHG